MASFGLGKQQQQQQSHNSGSASSAVHQQQQQQQPPVDDSTPWVAAADGDLPLLQHALRQLNLPVTAADENGYTLLQAAASYSQLPVLTWILEQARQQQQQQPPPPSSSQQQQEQEQPPSLPLLSQFVNAVDRDGDSALHYASTAEVARVLVEETSSAAVVVDTQLRNGSGLTALQSKRAELDELLSADDVDEDDDNVDVRQLKELIAYLETLDGAESC